MEQQKIFLKDIFLAQQSCLWIILIFCLMAFSLLSMPPQLRISACDVGQGDAVVIHYGQSVVLIDTGPNSSVLRCLQAELSLFDPTIDLVVLTHPDKDHVGGWDSVSNRFHVSRVIQGRSKHFASKTETVLHPTSGDLLRFPGVMMPVVWEEQLYKAWYGATSLEEKENEQSIGLYLAAKSFGFLSLGDLGCREELAVVGGGLLNKVTVLKTSHHGSKSSSCHEFIEKIRPETAFISVGENNSYNHPGENVLFTLGKFVPAVYRTDLQGKIVFNFVSPGKIFVSTKE